VIWLADDIGRDQSSFTRLGEYAVVSTNSSAADVGSSLRFMMVASGYPPVANGGLERSCERFSRALARRGYSVTVLTLASPGLPRFARDDVGVVVARILRPLRFGPLWGVSYVIQTAFWLWRLRERWDMVLCHQCWIHSIAAAAVARRLGKVSASKIVAGDDLGDLARLRSMRGGKWLVKLALRTDAQFVLSTRIAREVRAAGAAGSRVFPYRNFVDTRAFPVGAAPRAGFLYVGRFVPEKNLALLVAAFERVHEAMPSARLRLVGAGPEEAALRARVARSPAASAIRIDPWTSDPAGAYRDALALVMSSDSEGLPNVLIEAMSCGTPVITTDASGARDILGDEGWPEPLPTGTFQKGRGGLLVNRGDISALSSAMLALLRNTDLVHTLSREARARVESAYEETACVDAFLRCTETLLASSRGSR
jgi:glycosyltransferase involved in cell wall biosynthesis